MTSSVFMAIFSFAATNIDDIFVLMLLYAQVRNLKEIFPIIAGQYFGMGCLIILSTLGTLGVNILSPDYVGFLGFLPLFLGIRAKDKILRYQHILVPVVLIILGLTILAKLPFPDF